MIRTCILFIAYCEKIITIEKFVMAHHFSNEKKDQANPQLRYPNIKRHKTKTMLIAIMKRLSPILENCPIEFIK